MSTTTTTHRQQQAHLHRSPKPEVPPHPSASPRHRGRSSRRRTRRAVAVAVLVVVSVHVGLLVFFHLSLLRFLQEDVYATVAHRYPWILSIDAPLNASGANETSGANASAGTDAARRLPPPPWPPRRDGCSAEDGTRPYCRFHNLLIDLARVGSTAIGGEPLFSSGDSNRSQGAMGQSEADEYLTYQPGAFRILAEPKELPIVNYNNPESFHYVNDVLSSLQVIHVPNVSGVTIKDQNCTSYYYGTTLFLQRYEYVNLYHTLTDWWNTWTVYRHVRESDLAHFAVVFLDAHPEGNLDPVWATLFGRAVHLRRLDDDNIHPRQQERMCFQRALLVPPGYISHLWPLEPPNGGVGDNRTYAMMNSFVDFVLEKFRLSHVQKVPGRVVVIDRKPYVAHPRSRTVEDRSLNNLADVAKKLTEKVPNVTSVRIVALHNMTFREQVEAIREAEVLVGNHGAGLSHLVFMDDDSHVIEFEMNFLTFFNHLSACKQGRVTLHQLPDVRGSVSDAYFGNVLLPEFFRIYGVEPQPELNAVGDRPQILVDAPTLSDAIEHVASNKSELLEGAGKVTGYQTESKKPQEQKVVGTSARPKSNIDRGDKQVRPEPAQSRLRDTLDSLVAKKQVEAQQSATVSVSQQSDTDRAANSTIHNRTHDVPPSPDPRSGDSSHRNRTAAQGKHVHNKNNRTKDSVAFDSHRSKGSSRGANHSLNANQTVGEIVKSNSSTAWMEHRASHLTENGTRTSVDQIRSQGIENATNCTSTSESWNRMDSTQNSVNASRRVGKAFPLREVDALTKANDTVPVNETVNVPHNSSVAHLPSLNRTGNEAKSGPVLEVVKAPTRAELNHRNVTNRKIDSPPSSVARMSHRNGSTRAVNADPERY